ncbi:hypothetical protein MPH_04508 [Macrophomina phaseolina MS6]|uniref:Uncharacterized protein n=1 Tax=Macrophomina phaseolina (strain MS6) TaxID=1126212 RepID=K2RTY3_MACPH|nr:hypothetical protein MPH_04508 [Macrophomina phaseolina MS6]
MSGIPAHRGEVQRPTGPGVPGLAPEAGIYGDHGFDCWLGLWLNKPCMSVAIFLGASVLEEKGTERTGYRIQIDRAYGRCPNQALQWFLWLEVQRKPFGWGSMYHRFPLNASFAGLEFNQRLFPRLLFEP